MNFHNFFHRFLQGRIQGGAMGAEPPWTSEIYWFQGVSRLQRVLSPPTQADKILNMPLVSCFTWNTKVTLTEKPEFIVFYPLKLFRVPTVENWKCHLINKISWKKIKNFSSCQILKPNLWHLAFLILAYFCVDWIFA